MRTFRLPSRLMLVGLWLAPQACLSHHGAPTAGSAIDRGSVERSERAFDSALRSGDFRTTSAALARVMLVVNQRGDTLHDAALQVFLNRLAGPDTLRADVLRTASDLCIDGATTLGVLTLDRVDANRQATEAMSGVYAIRWVAAARGQLRPDSLTVRFDSRNQSARYHCRAPWQLAYERRRVELALENSNAVSRPTKASLRDATEEQGWSEVRRGGGYSPEAHQTYQARFASYLALALRGRLAPVSIEGTWPLQSTLGFFFSGNYEKRSTLEQAFREHEARIVASVERGRLRFGAGPTFLTTTWDEYESPTAVGPPRDPAYPTTTHVRYTEHVTGLGLQSAFQVGSPFHAFAEVGGTYRIVPRSEPRRAGSYPGGGSVNQNVAHVYVRLGTMR